MKMTIVGLCLVLLFTGCSEDLSKYSSIFYKDKEIGLKIPKGWVLDLEVAKADEIPAVIYKEGESWEDGETVMYLNFMKLNVYQENIDVIISRDKEYLESNYKGVEVKFKEELTSGEFETKIQYSGGGDLEQHEYLSYVAVENVAMMWVLSSTSKEDLDKHYDEFKSMLTSTKLLKEEAKE